MKYRKLGDSALEVSVISFGAWQIGDSQYWGEDDRTDADVAVRTAIDSGVNLFDTAETYGQGRSEDVLGQALAGLRDKVYIASKMGPQNCRPDLLRQACEQSLKRLGMETIDLYQVHWPSREVPFEDTCAELQRLQEEGKIREIGVSNFGIQDLTAWESIGHCVSNQLGYNLLSRSIEFEILPACQRHSVGVLAYMPLLQGILSGRWATIDDIPMARRRTRQFSSEREGTRHSSPGCEDAVVDVLDGLRALSEELGEPVANIALAWCIAQPGVTSVIAGGRKPHQIERNLAAADLELASEVVARLNTLSDPVKEHMGTNADLWFDGDAARIR